jgi:hypothetical protein
VSNGGTNKQRIKKEVRHCAKALVIYKDVWFDTNKLRLVQGVEMLTGKEDDPSKSFAYPSVARLCKKVGGDAYLRMYTESFQKEVRICSINFIFTIQKSL